VTYNSEKQSLKKEIPASYIGKNKSSTFRIASKSDLNQLNFTNKDEDLDEIENDEKSIGKKLSEHDLAILTLNPLNTFKTKEVVAVARSNGGFTYGKLIEQTTQDCSLGPHQLAAWKVLVDEKKSIKNSLFWKHWQNK